jgi:hypothetical protein
MSGHRDDGTSAEDKSHHEGRKVPRERFMTAYAKHEMENPDIIDEADAALDAEYASYLDRTKE